MQYIPIRDQVLVELDPFDKQFSEHIHRPDIADEKPVWGTVRGVGPGAYQKRGRKQVFIPTTVKIGDRVYVPWATGHDMKIGDRLHVQLSEADILAVGE